jgi:hypothetical protein
VSKKLEGKVAVITGGNSGIGLAAAKRFADEGASVVITGRRQGELEAAVREIGAGAIGTPGDVSSLADLDRLYKVVWQRYGRIDVLFANAGVPALAPLGEITEDHSTSCSPSTSRDCSLPCRRRCHSSPTGGRSSSTPRSPPPGGRRGQRLQRDQGRGPVVRPLLDQRPQAPQEPRQRHQPRPDRDADLRQGRGDARGDERFQGE